MPLYYFHVHDGADRPDRDGTDLPGSAAVRAEALMLAGRIVIDAGIRQDARDAWHITVADHTGLTLLLIDVVVAEAAATGRVSPHANEMEVG